MKLTSWTDYGLRVLMYCAASQALTSYLQVLDQVTLADLRAGSGSGLPT